MRGTVLLLVGRAAVSRNTPGRGQSYSPKPPTSERKIKKNRAPPCFFGLMNPLPVAALPRTHSTAGSIANAAPISSSASPTSVKGKRSRKRESSSASEQDGYEGNIADKRRQPGVKRACNECRQQKVSCALAACGAEHRADESLIAS